MLQAQVDARNTVKQLSGDEYSFYVSWNFGVLRQMSQDSLVDANGAPEIKEVRVEVSERHPNPYVDVTLVTV